jgi:hypothetical protein
MLAVGMLAMLGLLGTAAPAEAWGEYGYTAPWGCSAWFESWPISGGGHAATIKTSSGSCASMYARVRTSTGGGSVWVSHPSNASINYLAANTVGGQHKVCAGCTVFNT